MQNLSCKNEFYLRENKSFALSLALKQRLEATRKWPIVLLVYISNCNLGFWETEQLRWWTEKSGGCREVAVSGGSTLIIKVLTKTT